MCMMNYYLAYLDDKMTVEQAYMSAWNAYTDAISVDEKVTMQVQLETLRAVMSFRCMDSKGYELVTENGKMYFRK